MNIVEAIFLLHSAEFGSDDLLDAVECLMDFGEFPLLDEVLEKRWPSKGGPEWDTSRWRQAKYDAWAKVWEGPTVVASSGRRVLPKPDVVPGDPLGFSASPEGWGIFSET